MPYRAIPGCNKDHAHADGIWAVVWSEFENTIVTGSVDDLIKTWHCEEREDGAILSHKQDLSGHQLGIMSLALSSTGKIASSALDSQIKIWDIRGSLIKDIDAGPVECWTVTWSPDGKFVASGSQGGNVNVWSIESGEREQCLETNGKFVMSVAYSSDGRTLACGGNDGLISVFDVSSGKLTVKLEGHSMPVRTLAFIPGSSILLSGSDDGHINMYDTQSASKLHSLPAHDSWVLSVSHNPTKEQFASASSDKCVKLWDTRSRECVHTFRDLHKDQVWDVAYKPDGTQLVSVSDDRSMIVYDCS